VLSFPRDEPPKKPKSAGRPTRVECAGDIAVCLDCVRENAVRFDVPFDEELKRVLIHGILHIAGWDHKDNSPRRAMLRLQERLLDRVSAMEVA
jgi:probable rRNA maturation factor